jgi:hypothetical protein
MPYLRLKTDVITRGKVRIKQILMSCQRKWHAQSHTPHFHPYFKTLSCIILQYYVPFRGGLFWYDTSVCYYCTCACVTLYCRDGNAGLNHVVPSAKHSPDKVNLLKYEHVLRALKTIISLHPNEIIDTTITTAALLGCSGQLKQSEVHVNSSVTCDERNLAEALTASHYTATSTKGRFTHSMPRPCRSPAMP